MQIIFDALGFASANAFIRKNNYLHEIGYVRDLGGGSYKCMVGYTGLHPEYLTPEDYPTADQIIEEYKKQLAARGGKAWINKTDIVYAG